MSAVLEARGLSRFFEPATWALKDASLTVYPGDTVAITGASGSGKSTLLSLLGLLDAPTEGRLEILGADISRSSASERTRLRRAHIAFIFQAYHLIPHFTALENIAYTLQLRGASRTAARAAGLEALEAVGLGHRVHERPTTMSGGEQQRVAVARALACQPDVLLCDEPTGNLDTENSHRVLDLLLASAEGGQRATIIITHEPDIASRCSRRFIMKDGVLSEDSLKG